MDDSMKSALLPAGLRDQLPPLAEHEEEITRALLDRFASYGYQRVKPPLVEFEEGLLNGVGAAVATQTFRLMDPISQRMMGVRADITPQIARIATTRLKGAPRPLRLSYGGEVLRVKGNQLRPERGFRQVGVELVGAAKATMGDAEVILLAAEALREIQIEGLSVDINVPQLARAVCSHFDVEPESREPLLAALDRKDAVAIAETGGDAAAMLNALLAAAGPADAGLAALEKIDLPGEAEALGRRLNEVVELVREAAPDLSLTIDPVESRGFEYHTGVSFTLFALDVRGELGSGGRYLTATGEPATGFTLFMDTLLSVAPRREPRRPVFVPFEAPLDVGRELRDTGWITVNGLVPEDDAMAEARRLGCGDVWLDGAVRPVEAD
jgi:ATP phosphoribosyltransferase regulatory subunit